LFWRNKNENAAPMTNHLTVNSVNHYVPGMVAWSLQSFWCSYVLHLLVLKLDRREPVWHCCCRGPGVVVRTHESRRDTRQVLSAHVYIFCRRPNSRESTRHQF
jgi:hypothetical protein